MGALPTRPPRKRASLGTRIDEVDGGLHPDSDGHHHYGYQIKLLYFDEIYFFSVGSKFQTKHKVKAVKRNSEAPLARWPLFISSLSKGFLMISFGHCIQWVPILFGLGSTTIMLLSSNCQKYLPLKKYVLPSMY